MVRSCVISSAAFLARKDPYFVNRKRSNVGARECFKNDSFERKTLDRVVSYHGTGVGPIELECCKNLVNNGDHHRNQRLECLEEAFGIAQGNPREENACQKVTNEAPTLLLVGCVQLGSLTTARAPLLY